MRAQPTVSTKNAVCSPSKKGTSSRPYVISRAECGDQESWRCFLCERNGHPQDLCNNLSIADRIDQESRRCFVRQRMGRSQKSMPPSLLIPIGNPNMADRIDQESRQCFRPSKNKHCSSRSSKSMPSSSSKSYVMIWAWFAVSIKKAGDDLSSKEWGTRRSTWKRYHNRDIGHRKWSMWHLKDTTDTDRWQSKLSWLIDQESWRFFVCWVNRKLSSNNLIQQRC